MEGRGCNPIRTRCPMERSFPGSGSPDHRAVGVNTPQRVIAPKDSALWAYPRRTFAGGHSPPRVGPCPDPGRVCNRRVTADRHFKGPWCTLGSVGLRRFFRIFQLATRPPSRGPSLWSAPIVCARLSCRACSLAATRDALKHLQRCFPARPSLQLSGDLVRTTGEFGQGLPIERFTDSL